MRNVPPPPRNGENCGGKVVLFKKGLFLATSFPKIVKNSNFLLNFHPKFSKFSQNFQQVCFVQTMVHFSKIHVGFFNCFEKSPNIMHCLQFS